MAEDGRDAAALKLHVDLPEHKRVGGRLDAHDERRGAVAAQSFYRILKKPPGGRIGVLGGFQEWDAIDAFAGWEVPAFAFFVRQRGYGHGLIRRRRGLRCMGE